jgi:hypothetical protein
MAGVSIDYEMTVTLLALWTALAAGLAAIRMVLRRNKDARDYGATIFVASVAWVFLLIALRMMLEWPRWVVIPTLTIMGVSSTGLLVWIVLADRRGKA